MSRTIFARILVITSVVMAVGLIVAGGAMKPGYSHVSQYISELNATGTPWAREIGWLGFAPLAVVLFTFLVVAYPGVRVDGVSRLGYLLMFTQPLAYITAAVAPCDTGCPQSGSMTQEVHNLLGFLTYVGAGIGLILLSRASSLGRGARAGFVFAGGLWLGTFFLMVEPAFAPWRGLLQRIVEAILWLAFLFIAWRMMPDGRSAARVPSRG